MRFEAYSVSIANILTTRQEDLMPCFLVLDAVRQTEVIRVQL